MLDGQRYLTKAEVNGTVRYESPAPRAKLQKAIQDSIDPILLQKGQKVVFSSGPDERLTRIIKDALVYGNFRISIVGPTTIEILNDNNAIMALGSPENIIAMLKQMIDDPMKFKLSPARTR
jgi:uncharacterized SAM-binding protein YcdF (DUF218 family)